MTHAQRFDSPGSWHHVVNRGIARRCMFEDRTDIRHFLAQLARESRSGRIELHAWSVLSTHYHLLVRSPGGELSEAMQRVQNNYSRFYNRRHRRDGPLVRGRFFSRALEDEYDRRVVVAYIDRNAVQACLVDDARDYPWCSAAQYARVGGPRWLTREWVEGCILEQTGTRVYEPAKYVDCFTQQTLGEPAERALRGRSVERLTRSVVDAAPQAVRRWMDFKSRLADGQPVGRVVSSPARVSALIQERRDDGKWMIGAGERRRDAWPVVETALLRLLCGEPWARIGERLGCSTSTGFARFRRHLNLCRTNADYAERVSKLAAELTDEALK